MFVLFAAKLCLLSITSKRPTRNYGIFSLSWDYLGLISLALLAKTT